MTEGCRHHGKALAFGRLEIQEDGMPQAHPFGKVPSQLDNCGQSERKCGDAGTEPTQADIQHLCRIWAGVGRAILLRRKQTVEEDAHSY